MKKIKQTKPGQCAAAAVESLLELDAHSIPETSSGNASAVWLWLHSKGYKVSVDNFNESLLKEDEYSIVGIKTGSVYHAVIYKGKEPYYDPNPENYLENTSWTPEIIIKISK